MEGAAGKLARQDAELGQAQAAEVLADDERCPSADLGGMAAGLVCRLGDPSYQHEWSSLCPSIPSLVRQPFGVT